jgi:LysM repeat protein
MHSDHTKTIAFIEDYRSFTAAWEVNHKDYTNKIKRNDALNALAINYKMSVKEVKNKVKSLQSYFEKEHHTVTEKRVVQV